MMRGKERLGLVRFLHDPLQWKPQIRRTGETVMPLYSYHCAECDKDVEVLIGSSDTPVCPTCASQDMERLVSRTAPEGKSRSLVKSARAQAAREGHLSHFSRSKRRR
jgi:putative FmdB family regulatory protein